MNEQPFYKIVFIGDLYVGKTTIVDAITKQRLKKNYHETMGMTLQKIQLAILQQTLKLHIYDTSGAKRNVFFTISLCKDANVIILVIDARKKIKHQMESIISHKKELAQEIIHPIPLLLIANTQNEGHYELAETDLVSVGIDPKNYVLLSAEQIIDEKLTNRPSMLETKIAEQLVDARPHFKIPHTTQHKERTCSFFSFAPIKWISHFFQSTPPSIPVLSFNHTVNQLSREQVQVILQAIHRHLKNGALNNLNKPYNLGWFGFGGTRLGGFIVANSLFKHRDIVFESKTKYPEDIMRWISMTMVSMTGYKTHTTEDCQAINLNIILKKLYENILNTNNSFSLKLLKEDDTTLAFYKNLPRFIEEEVKRVRGINNHPASPLLSVNHHAPQVLSK